ncbi:MAG TPA: DUF6602 domain-containing protein [Candidatus Saccharimonadales bacterium]|nr:DUF6602 domain-containing protein [Candidatus Saccharimonadales bacterium]
MANQHVLQRLLGIQQQLVALHAGGASLSSATKGGEREDFINKFLAEVVPTPYRFGSGDITDTKGSKSGQVDLVVEYPFLPSLPMVGGSSRLYLAESVAAVIEVKSDIANQWNEVKRTADAVKSLERRYGAMITMGGNPPTPKIPVLAVGYKGWSEISTLESKIKENPNVDAILVIDKGLFVSNSQFFEMLAEGPWALWCLIQCIHTISSTVMTASANPIDYAR